MTRNLYKGLQCSKSREEVEQSYSEGSYKVHGSGSDMLDLYSRMPLHTFSGLTWVEYVEEFSPKHVSGGPLDEFNELDELKGSISSGILRYEGNGETFIEVNPELKNTSQAGEYTMTWGGIDITDGCGVSEFIEVLPVSEDKPKMCQHNDCGWCYYKGDKNSNDNNGQCNKSESCEVING